MERVFISSSDTSLTEEALLFIVRCIDGLHIENNHLYYIGDIIDKVNNEITDNGNYHIIEDDYEELHRLNDEGVCMLVIN